MALKDYKRKRNFGSTPEPTGGDTQDNLLHFVVQKHQASRLHYDFRLEMEGVLRSWAVPKGPSLNPGDKRLAIQVEDHPFDYKDFEGVIPEGNYGAGTVIVWDQGSYEPLEAGGKKAMEKTLLKQWKEGSLKFRLNGSKLKGEFALVRMKGAEDNAWLLIKHNDDKANRKDVTAQDKSVVSGKTLEQVASVGAPGGRKQPGAQKQAGVKAPLPSAIRPMLATLTDAPFDRKGWIFEVKWDGYRAIAYIGKEETTLLSRNGKSFDEKFFPVWQAVKDWKTEAVVDGEIVAVTDAGLPDFARLQNWRGEEDGRLLYYVFDLLWYDGRDMTSLPLKERQAVLHSLVPENHGVIRIGHSVEERGIDFFDASVKIGLEGIIAKRADSLYFPGQRSDDWLKIKARQRQEAVIGGYTRLAGTSRLFSSLLLGVFEDKKLRYVGKVGTGFKESEQKKMLQLFSPLESDKSPFSGPITNGKRPGFRTGTGKTVITWLKPELVCEVNFTEKTTEGLLRHPAFIAIREDKNANDVMDEKKLQKAPGRAAAKQSPSEETKVVNGVELQLTNLNKILWPEDRYTKGDMIRYYSAVAPYILPYLKNRPQSLNRFPNGIRGKSFYQKDVTGKVPDWVEQYPYKTPDDRRSKHYMLCNNKAALLLMANLGAIEMNPWSSTILKPEHPTWCIFDLDPDKDNTFDQVLEVARAIHDFLEGLQVPSFCKTSGSTGLHIYVPLGARYTYDQSQLFARWVASEVDSLFEFTSVERMTDKRQGKVYIDFLQNRPAATLAAPYSLRPKPHATVSMPLHWEEVKSGLKMTDFTIENAEERLKSEGDIFKPVLGRGIDLKRILKEIK
ncbi:MAG: DNA ligase D [Cytophagaceae bacterium SCN 52-12]|nr:MAG: DNA ligase D [Cytophagaceae bacterium SCN 52-12]